VIVYAKCNDDTVTALEISATRVPHIHVVIKIAKALAFNHVLTTMGIGGIHFGDTGVSEISSVLSHI